MRDQGKGLGWEVQRLGTSTEPAHCGLKRMSMRDFFIDNLLVRIHSIIKLIRWTGLAPWEFVCPGGDGIWLSLPFHLET